MYDDPNIVAFRTAVKREFSDIEIRSFGGMLAAFERYIHYGWSPGGFGDAVLKDLSHAIHLADTHNFTIMPLYKRLMDECMPWQCHGSPEIVEAWKKLKRTL